MGIYLANVCALERWRLAHGATHTARRSLAALRAWNARRGASPLSTLWTHCIITVDAQLAVAEKAPDAPQRVARLDSVLLTGPAGAMQDVGNLVVARLKEAQGDTVGA